MAENSAGNSAEYSTLIDLTVELRLAVRAHLISLSGALLATRLISPDNETELRDTINSEAKRSAKLIELVQNKVRQNSRHYHTFTGILKGDKDSYVYNDILQKLEQTYSSHQQEDDRNSVDTAVNVQSRINYLERRLKLLHRRILTELEDKNAKISDILQSITMLPAGIRQEYKPAIREVFPALRRETTINDLFYHLNPLVDFLCFGLLKYIIDQFGSNTLKGMMNEYSEDVVVFTKETTVKQLMDHWPGQQEIPPNFSKLQAKIDEDPTTYTLYRLEQLRKRYCCELKLTDLVFVIIGLEMSNSFIVEWLVPSALVQRLMESARKLDLDFYLRERIVKVLMCEKQIFPIPPDSRPMVPALQATAASVTDLKEDEETDQAVTQLSSSVEQLSLSPLEEREVQRIRDQLSDSALYSGVGIVCNYDLPGFTRLEKTLSELKFKRIELGWNISSQVYLKTIFSTVAQFVTYPKSLEAGLQPFVIAVIITGWGGHFPGSLVSPYGGSLDIMIVDDIIKPFLPKSAPHLVHIPKLFFISSLFSNKELDTQPPLFPDDHNGNYCVAYHLARRGANPQTWSDFIAEGLLSGRALQDVIENSQSHLDKDYECLYTFSCLKDNNIVLRK